MTFVSKDGNILTCNNFYKHPPISFKYLDHGTEECPLCKMIDAEKDSEHWKEDSEHWEHQAHTAWENEDRLEDEIKDKDSEIWELKQTIKKLEAKD